MTDRQLLELAAKAAGIERKPCPCGECDDIGYYNIDGDGQMFTVWNPLDSSADAFELAVGLHMSIDFFWNFQTIAHLTGGISVSELHNKDPLAATRRAITRAAAAIGEGMK